MVNGIAHTNACSDQLFRHLRFHPNVFSSFLIAFQTPRQKIQVFFVKFGAKVTKEGPDQKGESESKPTTKTPGSTPGWEVTDWPHGNRPTSTQKGAESKATDKLETTTRKDIVDDYEIFGEKEDKTTTTTQPWKTTAAPIAEGSEEKIEVVDNEKVEGGVEEKQKVEGGGDWEEKPEVESTTTTTTTTTTTVYPFTHPEYDCTDFSDQVCYESQQRGEDAHPCCYKGIYLTDLCTKDCTADMYDLCCFQRFQQARYRCCQDPNVKCDRPDEFSRCCYEAFTEDIDHCCPQTVAEDHWDVESKIVEYCLPNVYLDYGNEDLKYKYMGEERSLKLSRPENRLNLTCEHQRMYPKCKSYYFLPGRPQIEDDNE